MKVITLLNEKGGVGKTTTAVHIAAGLAIRGQRVLLIDADAQGNATQELGLPDEGGLYRLLVQDQKWGDTIRTPSLDAWASPVSSPGGSLWVIPSNIETRAIPIVVDDARLIRDRLEEIADHLDIVVIDTSPTPSMLHAMVYVASDYLIYPTKCEYLSLEGVAKTVQHMEKLNGTRAVFGLGETKLLGVQPTMFNPRTNAHSYGVGLLAKQFKRQTWPALPVRTIWRDRSFAQQTLFSFAPDDVATVEAWAMVERVEKGIA